MIEIRTRIYISGGDELEETAEGVEQITMALKRKLEGSPIYVLDANNRINTNTRFHEVQIDGMECVD